MIFVTVGTQKFPMDRLVKDIDRLAKEGKSLIMISGYMPELVNNCDRVIVMNGGYKVAEFEKGIENFEEKIFTAMLGGTVE